MAFSSFVKIFVPKNKIFYELFEEVTATLCEMAEVFTQAVSETDDSRKKALLKSLEILEHKNDETTHKIFIELGHNFITPFDREDIHYLTTSLDDIADYIWGASKRIVNYDIDDSEEGVLKKFADIISKSVKALHISVHELRSMKNLHVITDACVQINSLENDGDDLLDSTMMQLFNTYNISAVELVKKKDIYQMLETVTDKCEDAANVIESIIIKYA
jgi:predicted phosphate transport protein (TIGR00153 family)